ncbi:uncharacterized protein [Amphiura filiformis]|uniref:uncharacterized protein n=1 Tax=Amphiura filiformis TaxID=82378 RepID=UPI003B216393
MEMNLVVMVVGIFIIVCNARNSGPEDCIGLCDQCVEVSDTLAHMECTKHCEELWYKDDEKLTCSRLTAPNKGNPSLEDEINAYNAKISEIIESGDYSKLVKEFYTDDCVTVIDGQAPWFGEKDLKQAWLAWSEGNPNVDRVLFTTTAFGENNGMVWADGIANSYQNDALVGSFRYMVVYKRINGTLLRYIVISFP